LEERREKREERREERRGEKRREEREERGEKREERCFDKLSNRRRVELKTKKTVNLVLKTPGSRFSYNELEI
jgi:hypothetical protein